MKTSNILIAISIALMIWILGYKTGQKSFINILNKYVEEEHTAYFTRDCTPVIAHEGLFTKDNTADLIDILDDDYEVICVCKEDMHETLLEAIKNGEK